MACLKSEGTIPDSKLLVMMARMRGEMVMKTSFKRREGMMSEGQEVGFRWETTSDRWEGETGRKLWKVLVGRSLVVWYEMGRWISALMLLILSVKKCLNFSQVSMSAVGAAAEAVGLRMELIVLKST